jgi:cytochrome oxidase Cu insertion factor (SCO1/SenC/PrrC family)
MKSGLSDTNPIIVAAFKAALLHQGLIIAAVLVLLALAWATVRTRGFRRPGAVSSGPAGGLSASEFTARRVLRIGFGILWVFDGVLQAQPAMAAGLPSQVIEPGAATSPGWVQHLVNWGATAWSYHPVEAGAAAVWIQIGIGAWLLFAPSGWPSRLAGLVSAGWGLVVWVFGEAFGGIFAPGLTFLFGAPGAVLYYCAAGLLLALPEQRWRSCQLGRRLLGGLGLFLAAMAVLQAWPGRAFWGGQSGSLAGMASSMASTPQPHALAAIARGFASLAAAHGFAVNLVAVLALALTGIMLLAGAVSLRGTGSASVRARVLGPTVILLLVVCLADWLLIEDFGFFGGLGTDPNSMIPVALLAVSGYLALAPAPALEPAAAADTTVNEAAERPPESAPAPPLPIRLANTAIVGVAGAGLRAVFALWAAVIVIVGAGPMALAQASSTASPIIAQAIAGSAAPLNFTAPAFSLTDQRGSQVSLGGLRGKVVLLTFLDPVCTSDCPLIAQEFHAADLLLGARAHDVELVAIVANPVYRSAAYTQAFDSQEGLAAVPNWLFLTGSLSQLQHTWSNYGVTAQIVQAGGMAAHNDVAYVIDRNGHTRSELNFDPGPGTSSSQSSFAAELASSAQQVLGQG